MKSTKKWRVLTLIIVVINLFGCHLLNDYQKEGNLHLPGLKEPVKVLRDEKGMAYIYAKNIHDALMAQGFVTAQDRLFQMELTRLFATGRISELAGDAGKALDIRMRTIGFYRNAQKHEELLDTETRLFIQKHVDGVNAYIETRKDTHPLEFKLAGIKPGPWTIADSLAIGYYMGWESAGNLHTEIIAQMLVEKVGLDRAREIFPLNINPDDPLSEGAEAKPFPGKSVPLNLAADKRIMSYLEDGVFNIGSNNWAVGPELSPSGNPILANDPHLDARILPGPWYPIGIITPDFRVVGVIIPGTPGFAC